MQFVPCAPPNSHGAGHSAASLRKCVVCVWHTSQIPSYVVSRRQRSPHHWGRKSASSSPRCSGRDRTPDELAVPDRKRPTGRNGALVERPFDRERVGRVRHDVIVRSGFVMFPSTSHPATRSASTPHPPAGSYCCHLVTCRSTRSSRAVGPALLLLVRVWHVVHSMLHVHTARSSSDSSAYAQTGSMSL